MKLHRLMIHFADCIMAPTAEWKKLKEIVIGQKALKNLKSLDPKSIKSIQSGKGKNLLHVAAKYASLGISKYLVEGGCDINLRDEKHGSTPLIYALLRNDLESKKIVKFLVNSGADMSWTDIIVRDQSGIIFYDKKNIAALLCLTLKKHVGSYEAAADHLISRGWTFDNIACLQHDSIINCALKSDHNLNENYTKLKAAIAEQDVKKVKELLDLVAHSKRITSWLLQDAIKSQGSKSMLIIKLLLNKDAPVHGFIGDHETPIDRALYSCYNVNNTWILLDHGAKLDNSKIYENLCNLYKHTFLGFLKKDENELKEQKEAIMNCIRLLIEYAGAGHFHTISELPNVDFMGHLRMEYMALVRHFTGNDFFTYSAFMYYSKDFEKNPCYKECSEELEKMKNFKILEGVNHMDLLLKTIDEMIPYTRNDSFMDKIKEESFINMFPHYGKILQFKVNKALEKRLLIDHSINVLSKCLPLRCSCHSVLKKIVYFLSDPYLLGLE